MGGEDYPLNPLPLQLAIYTGLVPEFFDGDGFHDVDPSINQSISFYLAVQLQTGLQIIYVTCELCFNL